MTNRLALTAGFLAAFCCASLDAQTFKAFPGEAMNKKTLDTQERVESLYEAGDHERALFIYEHELAPLGDKYAQYMVGYMHLHGQSVSPNRVEALAWYRIAAERRETVLQKARDQLLAAMTPLEITRSNARFLQLWQRIGDTRLVMELIRKDMNILKNRTGSRIPRTVGSGPAVIYGPNGEILSPNYYRDVRVRLEARLNYLETRVEIRDIDAELEDEALRVLEEQVRSELASLEVP